MAEEYMRTTDSGEKARQWIGQVERHPGRRMRFKLDISSSALLVLDMQEFFLSDKSHACVPSARAAIHNIQGLVEAFRKSRRPIVFTRHSLAEAEEPGIMNRFWKDVVREGTPESALTPALRPSRSDVVLRKTRYSAFHGTDLENILRKRKVKSVVVTGVVTHLCCDSTARDAFMRDFEVYFVVDATASWTEDLHLSSLKALSDGVVIAVATEDVICAGGG